jgi:hypothetical protein
LYLKNTNKDYVQNYEQKKKWPTRSQNNQIVSYNTMVLQWRIFQKKKSINLASERSNCLRVRLCRRFRYLHLGLVPYDIITLKQ